MYNYRWTEQTTPDGKKHSTIDYPGIIVDHSTVVENTEALKDIKIPLRLHVGAMGVAPKEADVVNSIPPGYFGGNMDDRNVGDGNSRLLDCPWLYLPQLPGSTGTRGSNQNLFDVLPRPGSEGLLDEG